MKEDLSFVGKYAEQIKQRVTGSLVTARNTVESWRAQLQTPSFDEFMKTLSTGAVVKLFPTAEEIGDYYQRKRREDEEVYFNNPPWVSVYRQTGWKFMNHWRSEMPTCRKVEFSQLHDELELDFDEWDDRYGERYRNHRDWHFEEAVRLASLQQTNYPQMQFLVHGRDGLQLPRYYADNLHTKIVYVQNSRTGRKTTYFDNRGWSK